ncbi:MAG TPA: hypothetical protein VKT32_01565 [Chthonomonadaceae bacterium]|nr:hypothetical protein [Chthonomonadaceae bacterium]
MENKTAMLRQNRAYLLAFASEARKPYTGKSHISIPDNLFAQWYDSLPWAWRKFLSEETVEVLLRTEVALFRYHAVYDHYPDALAQLVPAYLPSVPDDPFGGGANIPLRYRVTGGGKSFLLYSLGPDLRDDGGKPARYPGDQPGDIVAGHIWLRKANGLRR